MTHCACEASVTLACEHNIGIAKRPHHPAVIANVMSERRERLRQMKPTFMIDSRLDLVTSGFGILGGSHK